MNINDIFWFDPKNPADVTASPSGFVALGVYNGRLYTKDSAGNVKEYANLLTDPVNATGGFKTETDGDTVHIFESDGTFTPSVSGRVEVLVIAGGGGGGNADDAGPRRGGGGGAGGVVYNPSLSVEAQAYAVTVGDGGAAEMNGENSSIGALVTAIGGGAGGSFGENGSDGGSGGGGSSDGTGNENLGGAGTAGQGHDGGNAEGGGNRRGGGGGGAAEAGPDTTDYSGGRGRVYSTPGLPDTFAVGGDGGNTDTGTPVAGENGTGNGGGGAPSTVSGDTNTGASGGSGIVVIRYRKS